jgi:hypothetical protein
MTKETDFMIQSLFQRESMDEITLDELKRHSEEFPYSSIVQFLYTCKLKSQYHLDFPEAVSKTALFFDDSSWLNYQLREEGDKGNFRKILYDTHFNNMSEDDVIETTEGIDENEDVKWVEEDEEFEGVKWSEDGEEVIADDVFEATESVEAIEAVKWVDDAEEENGEDDLEAVEVDQKIEEVKGAEEIEEIKVVEEIEEIKGLEEVEVKVDEDEVGMHEQASAQSDDKIETQVTETNTPSAANNDFEFPLTPYHTIDYFASLGIKINMEGDKDEISRKVKSFTAWLKTMKRLQPGSDSLSSKNIQSILDTGTEKENLSEAVLTEAMAEVYLKQGLREKAIEVYDKLSLLNPVNSHIFADKISQIKENKI